MSSLRRVMILGAGATVSLLALGFVLFASVVTRLPADNNPHADGIVVLTGEGRRIAEGARLLDEGRAQRMLISGVFRRTGKKALLEISGLPEDKFDCCVDVGYVGTRYGRQCQRNARLGPSRGYDSLIVVTASYHMPRSLAELSLAHAGDASSIPHPVVPNNFPPSRWWLHASVTRTLISEYFKFLPTAAHLTVARLLRSTQSSSVAEVPAEHSAGIF